MNYSFNLKPQYFIAIKSGTKTIEGRAPKNEKDKTFDEMVFDDVITFINQETGEQLTCSVLAVNKYSNTKEMLEVNGLKNILPGVFTIEEGIAIYNDLKDYKERIVRFGIYAIVFKLLN